MSVPQVANAEIAELVFKDDLTGLHNRRFLYRTFEEEWDELTRKAGEISLAIVDLDYFKLVNDTHGHLTGDLVLSETASLLGSSLGAEDRAIRYGGDEFIMLLPGRSKQESGEIAETLRRAMADKEFVSKEEQQPLEVVLSFSIGVATFPEDGSVGEELMAAADKALYASKKAGRNRVTLAGEIPEGLEDEIDLYRTFPSKSLVGRAEVIETLSEICDLVGPGMGTWTALSGPPGVGKSRLLHEVLRLAPESGASTVLVNLPEDLKDEAFAGIGKLYTEIGSRHRRAFQQLPQLNDPAFVHFLCAHAPESAPPADDPVEGAEPPSGDAVRAAILASLTDLCKQRRWLFLIDDAAYLDPHSCEVLREAIEDRELALGVISTHRSEGFHGDGEEPPGIAFLGSLENRSWHDQIVVEPLSLEATGVLITALLPNHHAPEDFETVVHEITGGNPLFVEEVLRIGIASERISRRGEDWFVQPISPEDVPQTLEEAVNQRLSLLDDEVGDAIARASAMGNSLTADVLQSLLGQNEGEILDFLDKAREHGFLQGGRHGDLSNLRFASGTLRDLAYQKMDAADRTKVHREIGKIEEHRAGSLIGVLATRLAYHFERGEVYEKARAYLESARLAAPTIVVAGGDELTEIPRRRRRRITQAAIPLPDGSLVSLDDAIRAIAHASKSLWMYPKGSPIVTAAFRDLHEYLEKLFEHAEVISLADVDGGLVVNGIPYPSKRQEFLVKGLLDQLRSRELSGVTLRKGMTEEETEFLVEQLATDEPVERDPDAWESMLRERQIENVDFGDRVYIRADGVASAAGSLSAERLRGARVVRIAPGSEGEVTGESTGERFTASTESQDGVGGALPVSAEDLQALLERLDHDAAVDAEIEALVPTVAELLKKLLQAADQATQVRHQALARLLSVEPGGGTEDPLPGEAPEPRTYLERIESEWDPGQQRELLGPAEEKFEAFVMSRDLTAARKVLRFALMCRTFDDSDGELAAEASATLGRMATGGTVQLLLADLLARPEQPDLEALQLLRELGDEAGRPLVTFLRETDDLRSRRVVAQLIIDIGGTTLQESLETITRGENPAVARRVISVLDVLSDDSVRDLSRAVRVRSSAVMGEAIKVLQRRPRQEQATVIGRLLQSASPELVCRGIYYLSEWSLGELADRLLELIEQSDSAEIVVAASAAAARLKIPEVIPVLGKMLGKKQIMGLAPAYSRTIRREFARALAAIGTSEARRQLAVFAKDIDLEVRNIARGMPEPTGP